MWLRDGTPSLDVVQGGVEWHLPADVHESSRGRHGAADARRAVDQRLGSEFVLEHEEIHAGRERFRGDRVPVIEWGLKVVDPGALGIRALGTDIEHSPDVSGVGECEFSTVHVVPDKNYWCYF